MKIHVGIDLMLFCVCIMIHMYANMFSSSSWIVCVSCYMSFTNSFDLLLKLVRTYVIMKKNDLWNVIVKLKIKMFNISNKKLDEPINKLNNITLMKMQIKLLNVYKFKEFKTPSSFESVGDVNEFFI